MVSPPDFFHHCNPAYRVLPGDPLYGCKGITQSNFSYGYDHDIRDLSQGKPTPMATGSDNHGIPADGTGRQALPPDRACKESADKVLIVDDPQRFDIALLLNDQRRI